MRRTCFDWPSGCAVRVSVRDRETDTISWSFGFLEREMKMGDETAVVKIEGKVHRVAVDRVWKDRGR